MVSRLFLILLISVSALHGFAEDLQRLSLHGDVATASFSTNGGGLVEFRLNENSINPLNWEVTQPSWIRTRSRDFHSRDQFRIQNSRRIIGRK